MNAATGFAAAEQATPDLATQAVKDALQQAGSSHAHGVILLLSSHFAHATHQAQAAVTAAARAAGCLQVFGATVPGVFTETSWALDQPAAAALVLCGDISLAQPRDDDARLSFAAPSHSEAAWIDAGPLRYGTLSSSHDSDADGIVWTQGKVSAGGRCEAALHGASTEIVVSRGIRVISPLLEVTDCDNFEVLQVSPRGDSGGDNPVRRGDDTALDSLLRPLDPDLRKLDAFPQQRLFAAVPGGLPATTDSTSDDQQVALHEGRYNLIPILHVNRDERSVTLAAPLPMGTPLWWVIHDPAGAEDDMRRALGASSAVPTRLTFGLMFSCIGRGPYFYQGHDRDVALVRQRFPGLPLLGAYGAGEIAPLGRNSALRSALISYSSVLTLVSAHV